MNYYTNAESLKTIHMGGSMRVNNNIANTLKRTGKTARSLINWANVEQVDVAGILCDLYHYDRGGITLQKGSDL